MKKSRIYFGLLLMGLIAVIIWSMIGMLSVGKKEEKYVVSVIVNDSNHDRWIAMRAGLEQAARDQGIELNYVSTGQFSNIGEEMQLIDRELEHGTDGLIVQMVDSAVDTDRMTDLSGRAAVMLIETDIMPEGQFAYTGPDHAQIGIALAQTLTTDLGGDLAEKTVGILAGNQKQLGMKKRLESLKQELQNAQASIAWTVEGTQHVEELMFADCQKKHPVDILITLGNDETELAVDYLLSLDPQKEKPCLLYGVGYSEKVVYYLDQGVIRALVVPNEFHMGYQSLTALAEQLKYRTSKPVDQTIGYLVVDRMTLYDDDNQKILFPIVQ